jgi:hypothetical protein
LKAIQSPVSHTRRQISQKRLSVDSSSAKIFQNSTGIFDSHAALSFSAAVLTRQHRPEIPVFHRKDQIIGILEDFVTDKAGGCIR